MAESEVPPKSALELQIEEERRELEAVPKIPIAQFMGGPKIRCHICGQIFPVEQLQSYDTHNPGQYRQPRLACPGCHPERGSNG